MHITEKLPKQALKAKLEKGNVIWRSKGGVAVCKWEDKSDVLTISNAHVPEMVTITNRHGNEKDKINIARDYNDLLPGIDQSDTILPSHLGLTKTLRWYKKKSHILEIVLTYTFYLYPKFSKFSHLFDFQDVVIKTFIRDHIKNYLQDNGKLPLSIDYFGDPEKQEFNKTVQRVYSTK